MSTLERAIVIAAEGHTAQTDKAGAPYIFHPLRMMLSLRDPAAQIVAMLHDLVEDCPGWTFERLRTEGFSAEIIEALEAVTKRDAEDYGSFVMRAGANPLARAVKLADLRDNCDLRRIETPTERDHARMAKYRRAIEALEARS